MGGAMSERISQAQYNADFDGDKRTKALEHALDIRKFEIDLYWRRATYFWGFIAATFAGYGAVQASSSLKDVQKTDFSVVLSCLGIVFSFGWFCVNKGSKQWQENWENHVDMLEDEVVGPLYKIVLKRAEPCLVDLITGPSSFSVSKVNQIISLFVTILWLLLLYKVVQPFSTAASINWDVVVIGTALASCVGFVTLGRTDRGTFRLFASKRKTEIDPTT